MQMRPSACWLLACLAVVGVAGLPTAAAADDADTCATQSGDVAIAACSRAIASSHLSGEGLAEMYISRAIEYQKKRDHDRAIADFNQAIRLDPKNADVYAARGNAWRAKGDLDRAIGDYDQAVRLDPKNADTYAVRGTAWGAKGDLDRAIADYEQAVRIDPKNVLAYTARANAWAAKGDLDRAIADYDQAIRIDAKKAGIYGNRGNAWAAKGDPDRAIANYDQAIRLEPKNASWYFHRGLGNFYAGALPKALADLERASALNPRHPYAALWLDIVDKRSHLPSRFAEAAKQINMTWWPAPVIRLYLGELTPGALLAAADIANPRAKRARLCEANFFTGELALAQGKADDAKPLLARAAADCPKDFPAYAGATAELKRLGARP